MFAVATKCVAASQVGSEMDVKHRTVPDVTLLEDSATEPIVLNPSASASM